MTCRVPTTTCSGQSVFIQVFQHSFAFMGHNSRPCLEHLQQPMFLQLVSERIHSLYPNDIKPAMQFSVVSSLHFNTEIQLLPHSQRKYFSNSNHHKVQYSINDNTLIHFHNYRFVFLLYLYQIIPFELFCSRITVDILDRDLNTGCIDA